MGGAGEPRQPRAQGENHGTRPRRAALLRLLCGDSGLQLKPWLQAMGRGFSPPSESKPSLALLAARKRPTPLLWL